MKQRWGLPLSGLTTRESSDLVVVPVLCPTGETFPTSSELVHHAKAITEVSLQLKLFNIIDFMTLQHTKAVFFLGGWFPLEQHQAGSPGFHRLPVCSGSNMFQQFQGVEAKLILLSQGGVAASRLASSLVSRRISMGEPQQVAPRSGPSGHGHARLLSEQPENVAIPSSDAQKVQLRG